jgi:PST family polysaccharide transporter
MRFTDQYNQVQLIRGAKWNSISILYRQLWFAVVMLLLARMLTPTDFGIIGMTAVIIQFFNILLNLGFEAAIVQRPSITRIQLTTLFWVNIIMGSLLVSVGIIFSPLVGIFYDMPELSSVFAALTIVLFSNSFGLVQKGLILREFKFKQLAKVETVSATIAGLTALLLSYYGFGFWSLVVQQIAISVINVLGFWLISSWRPSLIFKLNNLIEITKYSINVFYFNVLNFFTNNIDVIIIGKLVGSEQLGWYLMAYNIIFRPIQQLLIIFRKSLFPVISRLQNDLVSFHNLYIDAVKSLFIVVAPLLLLIIYPVYIGLPILLGSKWIPAFPFIVMLCFAGLRVLIVSPVGIIFLATGHPQYQWKLSLFLVLPFSLLGMWLGYIMYHSAFGVVLMYNIFNIFLIIPGLYVAFRIIALSLTDFFRDLSDMSLIFSLLILVSGLSFLFDLYTNISSLIIFIIHTVIGVFVYFNAVITKMPSNIASSFREGLNS